MSEIKNNEIKAKNPEETNVKLVRKCQVCDSPTKNPNQYLCDECKRTVLIVRTVLTLMEKDGLCFLAGSGNVDKEVKALNV